jgi:hypothetical protein
MTTLCLCDLVEFSKDDSARSPNPSVQSATATPESDLMPAGVAIARRLQPTQSAIARDRPRYVAASPIKAAAAVAVMLLASACQDIDASRIDAPYMDTARNGKWLMHGDDDSGTAYGAATPLMVDISDTHAPARLTRAEAAELITRATTEFHVGSAQLIDRFIREQHKCEAYANDAKAACLSTADAGRAATLAAVLANRANAMLAASIH